MASYPSYLTVFKTVKGTPKSAPPLTFLTNAEIPDALIQKGLRPAKLADQFDVVAQGRCATLGCLADADYFEEVNFWLVAESCFDGCLIPAAGCDGEFS